MMNHNRKNGIFFYRLLQMMFTFMEIPSAPCNESLLYFLPSLFIERNRQQNELFMTVPGAKQCVRLKMKPDMESSLTLDPNAQKSRRKF